MSSSRKKIAILGFGRSGTTWVSDIVSKSQGGLILFEPLFPSACKNAREYCYSNDSQTQDRIIDEHFDACLRGHIQDPWLLRNHMNLPVDRMSPSLMSAIWRECKVIGFKEIRANFLLRKLAERGDYNVVFLIRHPAAVISSLRNRPWFWKGDFGGLDVHIEMFRQRVLRNPANSVILGESLQRGGACSGKDDTTRQAVMWAATHRILLRQLAQTQVPVVFYEDLFASPFEIARKTLAALDLDTSRMHPSFLFTPSMVTLKTDHDLHFEDNLFLSRAPSFFWEGTLEPADVEHITGICREYDVDLYDSGGRPNHDAMSHLNVIRPDSVPGSRGYSSVSY